MRLRPIRLFALLFLLGCVADAQSILPFRVLAAEFSKPLNRIVMISAVPDQLHIYDPVASNDRVMALPDSPEAVSVSPDGRFAAVAMRSRVAYVDLATGTVATTYTAPGPVAALILAKEYIHVDLGVGRTVETSGLWSIRIEGGALTKSTAGGFAPLATGRLHPLGNAIYTTSAGVWTKVDTSTGPMTGGVAARYPGDFMVCGAVGFAADGRRIFDRCGSVATASETDAVVDMMYESAPAGVSGIGGISESTAGRSLAVLPGSGNYFPPRGLQTAEEVLLYDAATLEETGRLRLPEFAVGTRRYAATGKWLFFDAAGTVLYVVAAPAGAGADPNRFAVFSYDFGNPEPCVPVLAPAMAVGWNGTTGTVAVAAAGTCLYGATSDTEWLQPIQSGVRGGAGSVIYHVRANLTGEARTATLTIGGQAVVVTQDAAPAVLPVTAQMSYRVIDGEYSAALDRAVLVSAGPNELHLFTPETWEDTPVALAKAPLSVAVRKDGLYAAVGHDGWVSIVNLQTAEVEQFLETPMEAADILLDSSGWVYPLPSRIRGRLYPVDLATGRWTVQNDKTAIRRVGRMHPGGKYFYSGDLNLYRWSYGAGEVTYVPSSRLVPHCGNAWFSVDGAWGVTRCREVVQIADGAADLAAESRIDGPPMGWIEWADHSAARGQLATVTGAPVGDPAPPSLRFYETSGWTLTGSCELPLFRTGTGDVRTTGRYVFWSAGGSRLFLFTRLESTEGTGVLNDTFATLAGAEDCGRFAPR